MTATERRYFVLGFVVGKYLNASGPFSLSEACLVASQRHMRITRGQVYELADDGTVRLVAQMATVS